MSGVRWDIGCLPDLDLTPFTTSWGTELGIGPLAKSSQPDTVSNFNALISSQGISRTSIDSQTFDGTSYGLWTTAGEGVNSDATINDNFGDAVARPVKSRQQNFEAFQRFRNRHGNGMERLRGQHLF